MNKAEFHNALRILLNLDRDDLPFLDGRAWQRFRTDPFRFFIRADDPTADRLWAAIEARQRGTPACAVGSDDREHRAHTVRGQHPAGEPFNPFEPTLIGALREAYAYIASPDASGVRDGVVEHVYRENGFGRDRDGLMRMIERAIRRA